MSEAQGSERPLQRVVGRRYILHPGYVYSRTDGDRHYIGAGQLASLYGLRLNDCVVIRNDDPPSERGYYPQAGDVHLHPRSDGNYQLPPNANSVTKRQHNDQFWGGVISLNLP